MTWVWRARRLSAIVATAAARVRRYRALCAVVGVSPLAPLADPLLVAGLVVGAANAVRRAWR